MNPTYVTFASALLRGVTDEIACAAPTGSGTESIPELMGRFKEIDRQAHAQMRSALTAAFPEIGWTESEDKRDPHVGTASYWVYDPLDGAYHYTNGLPLWSSSLALVQNGKAVLALVYDPFKRELFAAEAGKGATLNGQPISATAKSRLNAAVVGTALPPFAGCTPAEHAQAVAVMVETAKHVFVMRQMAAASLQLAYVAAGRLDAYVETGDDVYDWLAGCLLVQEAGGIVTALDGKPFDVLASGTLAAAPGLHAGLQEKLLTFTEAAV